MVLKSANEFKHELTVLGLGEEWKGGDMNFAGGGQKVKMLKKALENHKNDDNLMVLFSDR